MSASPAASVRSALTRGDPVHALNLLGDNGFSLDAWTRLALTYRAATAAKAYSGALEAAQEAVKRFPDKADSHLYLATGLLNLGRKREGLRAAEAAFGRFPDDWRLLEIAARAAAENGRSSHAVARYERLIALGCHPLRQRIRIAQYYTGLYRGDEALTQFRLAIDEGADRVELAPFMALAAERAGRYDTALELWSEAMAAGSAGPEVRDALERLQRYTRREGGDQPRIGADDLLDLASPVSALTIDGDIRVWRRPRARNLVLVFGGLQTMMGVAPPMVPTALTERDDVNVLSFRDANRLLMLEGALSFGSTYAETLAWLTDLLKAWKIDRLYVVGYSVGGLAGLRYAVDLGARRLLLMSGALAMPAGAPQPFLEDLVARGGHRYFDAASLLAQHGDGLEVIAAFGAGNAADTWQAHRLKGVSGVTLMPLDGVTEHALALAPQHDDLIAQLIADSRPPRARA